MRQIAGFGTGADTNGRFEYLLSQGQTGLSTDFDMPTLMGYDSDHPMSHGEVGREGVAVDTIDDMEALFAGIDLREISVSLTINPSAWIVYAMYIALARRRGYDLDALSGTIQADILKEYIAQKEWIFPIRPSVRLVRDCIAWGARNMRRYNPVNISGYHISEAGATARAGGGVHHGERHRLCRGGHGRRAACGRVRAAPVVLLRGAGGPVRGGGEVPRAAPRVREDHEGAVRRPEAGVDAAPLPRADGGGDADPAAAPGEPDAHRLPGAGGGARGCQSLHANGMDEAFAIPTEEAMRLALRTQQVIAEETNVAAVADPLGGSWFVERLTADMERGIFAILDEVDAMGGTIAAIEKGWFQRRIADSAYDQAIRKANGERPVIGVNAFVEEDEEAPVATHPYDPETERRQIENLRRTRRERDNAKVSALLDELRRVAANEAENVMPVTIALADARASMGEIVETLRGLWGSYRETPVF